MHCNMPERILRWHDKTLLIFVCLTLSGVYTAGKVPTVMSAPLIPAVSTGHVWSPGSAFVTQIGVDIFATKASKCSSFVLSLFLLHGIR